MSATNRHLFITSGEKVLLAYTGMSFTITRVESSTNRYGPCWHVYARFDKPAAERIISLSATARRDTAMNQFAKQLDSRRALADVTLCYRWRAYHFVPRKRWRRPRSLDDVRFLR